MTTITNQLQELDAAKAKVVELENRITEGRRQALAALPEQFGFHSMKELIAALRSIAVPRSRHSRVTSEVRDTIKKMFKDGMKSKEISNQTGLSRPTIQIIKKQLGLVKERKGKSA